MTLLRDAFDHCWSTFTQGPGILASATLKLFIEFRTHLRVSFVFAQDTSVARSITGGPLCSVFCAAGACVYR